jgi:hypothetical protein
MADSGPFGPFLPFGRRGPLVGVLLLVAACGVAVGLVLVTTGEGCRTDRFGSDSGDGRTPDRPLLVDGPVALAEATRCPDRHLRQVADIDAPNPWTPLGLGRTGEAAFTGSYDGGGHRIVGLRVFLPGSSDAGLFGVLAGGEVRDLVLEDVVVAAGGPVGAVVGRATGPARVLRVEVRAARIAGDVDVGALVGRADATVTVEGRFVGTVEVAGRPVPAASLVGRVDD